MFWLILIEMSVKKSITINTMKTIYDFNPTDEELKRFGDRKSIEWARENGIELSILNFFNP